MSEIRDLLPLYAVGALEPAEAEAVERAISTDAVLAAELEAYTELLVAAIPPTSPPADVKARLLASIGAGRFDRLSAQIARILDLTVDRTRELLGLIERPGLWNLEIPGVSLIHFDAGPACATADCGFVQIAPGHGFPWHTHRGEEMPVIIAGTLRESPSGRLFGPGDELVQPAGSQHELAVEGTEPVIFVARAFDGIQLGPRP